MKHFIKCVILQFSHQFELVQLSRTLSNQYTTEGTMLVGKFHISSRWFNQQNYICQKFSVVMFSTECSA